MTEDVALLKNFYRIEWVKVIIQFLLLAFVFLLQFSQSDFIHWSLQNTILLVLTISFIFHFTFIVFLKKLIQYPSAYYLNFLFDIVWITILLNYFPNIQAVFIFLYLVQILLSGLVLQRIGALIVAGFTSLCFSLLLAISPFIEGQLLFLSLGLNNVGFFLIAFLSGTLSEQVRELSSELSKTTKDLQVLKDLNALIIENMQSGFISFDLDHKVLLFNKSASEILDLEIVENTQLEFIMPEVLKKIQKANQQAQPMQHIYRKSKRSKNLLLLYSDIYNDKNEKIGGLLIFSDQTQLKRLEEENKRNEKLAAIGKLAAGIAHEIRNPLASMSGSIQFLSANLKTEGDEEKKLMKIILKETDRLNDLVTEFLDFAKPEKTLSEEIDLASICLEIFSVLENDERFSNKIELKNEIQKDVLILGDAAKLRQVLYNLYINAAQAMEDSSVKRIRTLLKTDRTNAVLEISDSGSGMTDEVLERLFEPFHTTKAKGSGLGLAVVHKIVEHHNGRIEVESKKGEGTTFSLFFPLL